MSPSRREILKSVGLAGAAAGAGALAGCSSPEKVSDGPGSIKVGEVPVGSGTILEGTNYVVTQPTAGTFCAFVRMCPHAGCRVQKVEAAEIVCTCHDSRFAIADGAKISGPATGPLGKATATVDGDTVKVSG